MRPSSPRVLVSLLVAAGLGAAAALHGCSARPQVTTLAGPTMGARYAVTTGKVLSSGARAEAAAIVERELARVALATIPGASSSRQQESDMTLPCAFLLVASYSCAAPVLAFAQPVPGPEREVLALVQQSTRDWSRGDIDAFCAFYADDAVFVSPTGVTRGRQAVLERYRQRYADKAAMGSLTLEPLDTRVGPGPRPTTVSIAARWTLTYPDRPAATGLTLIVWQKTPAGWRIVQDASM